jgi:hypothetical protein
MYSFQDMYPDKMLTSPSVVCRPDGWRHTAMLAVFIFQDGRSIQEMRVETWQLWFHRGKT